MIKYKFNNFINQKILKNGHYFMNNQLIEMYIFYYKNWI